MGGGALAVGVFEVCLREQTDEAGAGRVGRKVQRQHLVAERLLRGVERVVVVRTGVIEFRDEDRAGHADLTALQPQRLGRLVDLLVGRDDEQRAVGGPQTGPQFPDEVGVTRRIDQVDLDPAVLERGERESDRALLRDLGLVAVADGGAVDDGARSVDYSGGDQQRLDECGLAATRWAHQHHIADGGRTVRGGGGSGRRSCRLVSHGLPFREATVLPIGSVIHNSPEPTPSTRESHNSRSLRSEHAHHACQAAHRSTVTVTTGPSSASRWY